MRNDPVAILIKKTALVIDKFANQDVPIRQADIEAKFSMTDPTVTGIIQNLEQQ